jgi:hypothetical protein
VSPEILKTIQADDLNLMIINDAPCFPGAAMRPDVKAELIKRFPHPSASASLMCFGNANRPKSRLDQVGRSRC